MKDKNKGKKKSKSKKIGKVNSFLYIFVNVFYTRKYVKKHNITLDKSVAKTIKGPAIVIGSHTCDVDHVISALNLYPVRPTYIVSEHFMHLKSTATFMKLMHVIPKKMFTPDLSTIRSILKAKKENAVIVIFPEGRLSCYGRTLPVTEGTAELLKKLEIDVYLWEANGTYLSFPKWRDKGENRVGKIDSTVKLLLSKEDVAAKDVAEIRRITEEALYHDDEVSMAGVEFKCENMARGLERVLYKCPKCHKEWTLTTEGDHIRCSCGLDATLDGFYKLHNAPYESINDWFEWQQNSIDTETEHLESHARFGAVGTDGYMDPNAGEGEVYMDKDEFRLSGKIFGEDISFSVKTEKIGAFPITPGDHIDIYHAGNLIYIYPEPNLNTSVKWVCYLDKFNQDRKAAITE